MNLVPETRRGYYISTEMKKVWTIEMKLLMKLLEVCNKYNLKIWAEGGTLLGTVRERGFIPWDDDMDFSMPRDDYNKLQSIASVEFVSPFFLQTGYSDLFPNGMAKLRMDGTSAIEKETILRKQHQGIFIDIFPLDALPNDPRELNAFASSIAILRRNLLLYCDDHIFSLTNWKYNYSVFKTVFAIWIKGFHKAFSEFEDYVSKYNHDESCDISLISWSYHERYIRSRKWYKKTIWMPFENITMPVPSGYHEILTKQYGNYMVPQQMPAVHNGFVFLSADTSFLTILPVLREKVLKERWRIRKYNILHFLGIR